MTGWRFAYSMFIRSHNYNRTMEKRKGRFILITTKPYSRFAWMKGNKQFGRVTIPNKQRYNVSQ